MNKKLVLSILVIAISIFFVLGCSDKKIIHHHYVDINNLVKEAFMSTNGYDSNMEKYMSKNVYVKSNAYDAYEKLNYKKPIKASFSFKEINQHKIHGDIFVYMKYTLEVRDATRKIVTGSIDTPVVFTVTENNGQLYLKDKQEYLNENDVEDIYR